MLRREPESRLEVFSSRNDFDDERRRIVAAGYLYGRLDELAGGIFIEVRLSPLPQQLFDLGIVEPVHQAIAAEQEPVAGLVADGTELRIDELMPRSQSTLKRILGRMAPGLALADFRIAIQPSDMVSSWVSCFRAPAAGK